MDNLVFSNMLHRPGRTFVSILGISVGVLLIVFTIGLTNGSLRGRAQQDANVGAEIILRIPGSLGVSGNDVLQFPVTEAQQIAKIEGIKKVIPLGQNSVEAPDSNLGTRLVDGVEFNEYAEVAGLKLIEGRNPESGDEVAITTAWQNERKLKIGDSIKLYDRDFKIVGTYEPPSGAHLKIPLKTMQEQLGSQGKCSTFLVKLTDPSLENAVGEKIAQAFPNKYQILPTSQLEELYANSLSALGIFIDVVVGVAAIISALVILLTMYTTVTERTRQIGVLKSLGMSNQQIGWIILQEALLISFGGIVLGVVLAVVLKIILSFTTNLKVFFDARTIIYTAVIGLIGGAIGAMYPAMKASRMDAVDALSYE